MGRGGGGATYQSHVSRMHQSLRRISRSNSGMCPETGSWWMPDGGQRAGRARVDGQRAPTQFLRFSDGDAEDVPALDEAGLGLVPVARVQQGLDVEEMVIADRDDAVQLAGGIVVLFGELLRRLAQIVLELAAQLDVGVLGGTGANHEEKTSPLKAEGLGAGPRGPPIAVVVEEGGGVNDVVVVVDVVEEVLHERVWACQRGKTRRRRGCRAHQCRAGEAEAGARG